MNPVASTGTQPRGVSAIPAISPEALGFPPASPWALNQYGAGSPGTAGCSCAAPASATFAVDPVQPWTMGLRLHRSQVKALQPLGPPTSCVPPEALSRGLLPDPKQEPSLLKRFYRIHHYLGTSSPALTFLGLPQGLPQTVAALRRPLPHGTTQACAPVIHSLYRCESSSDIHEAQKVTHQEASKSMPREERLSNVGVASATQMLQVQHGGNNPQLTRGVCESSPSKGSNRRTEADGPYRGPSTITEEPKGRQETPVELKWLEGPEVDWYKRELLKKLNAHRQKAAAKVRLIERAWLRHKAKKQQRQQALLTAERLSYRTQRNDCMSRTAARLGISPLVAEAFTEANAELTLPKANTDAEVRGESSPVAVEAVAKALQTWKQERPQLKEMLRRERENRDKKIFLENFAAAKIQAHYRGHRARQSIALRVTNNGDLKRLLFSPLEQIKRSGECWWKRTKDMNNATYWELVLDLKVQAIAEPVKAPEACTLLCKEAALVAEKLEGALKDPYQPFDASASLIPVVRAQRPSKASHTRQPHISSSKRGKAGAPGSVEPNQQPQPEPEPQSEAATLSLQEAARRHKELRQNQKHAQPSTKDIDASGMPPPTSTTAALTGSITSQNTRAAIDELPKGICREGLLRGYTATPEDVIAFRASALAVRALGPFDLRKAYPEYPGRAHRNGHSEGVSEQRARKSPRRPRERTKTESRLRSQCHSHSHSHNIDRRRRSSSISSSISSSSHNSSSGSSSSGNNSSSRKKSRHSRRKHSRSHSRGSSSSSCRRSTRSHHHHQRHHHRHHGSIASPAALKERRLNFTRACVLKVTRDVEQGSAPSAAANLWDLRVFEADSPASSFPEDQSEECVQLPSKLEGSAIPTRQKQLSASRRAASIKFDTNGTRQLAILGSGTSLPLLASTADAMISADGNASTLQQKRKQQQLSQEQIAGIPEVLDSAPIKLSPPSKDSSDSSPCDVAGAGVAAFPRVQSHASSIAQKNQRELLATLGEKEKEQRERRLKQRRSASPSVSVSRQTPTEQQTERGDAKQIQAKMARAAHWKGVDLDAVSRAILNSSLRANASDHQAPETETASEAATTTKAAAAVKVPAAAANLINSNVATRCKTKPLERHNHAEKPSGVSPGRHAPDLLVASQIRGRELELPTITPELADSKRLEHQSAPVSITFPGSSSYPGPLSVSASMSFPASASASCRVARAHPEDCHAERDDQTNADKGISGKSGLRAEGSASPDEVVWHSGTPQPEVTATPAIHVPAAATDAAETKLRQPRPQLPAAYADGADDALPCGQAQAAQEAATHMRAQQRTLLAILREKELERREKRVRQLHSASALVSASTSRRTAAEEHAPHEARETRVVQSSGVDLEAVSTALVASMEAEKNTQSGAPSEASSAPEKVGIRVESLQSDVGNSHTNVQETQQGRSSADAGYFAGAAEASDRAAALLMMRRICIRQREVLASTTDAAEAQLESRLREHLSPSASATISIPVSPLPANTVAASAPSQGAPMEQKAIFGCKEHNEAKTRRSGKEPGSNAARRALPPAAKARRNSLEQSCTSERICGMQKSPGNAETELQGPTANQQEVETDDGEEEIHPVEKTDEASKEAAIHVRGQQRELLAALKEREMEQRKERLRKRQSGSATVSRQTATEQHTPLESERQIHPARLMQRGGVDLEAVSKALLEPSQTNIEHKEGAQVGDNGLLSPIVSESQGKKAAAAVNNVCETRQKVAEGGGSTEALEGASCPAILRCLAQHKERAAGVAALAEAARVESLRRRRLSASSSPWHSDPNTSVPPTPKECSPVDGLEIIVGAELSQKDTHDKCLLPMSHAVLISPALGKRPTSSAQIQTDYRAGSKGIGEETNEDDDATIGNTAAVPLPCASHAALKIRDHQRELLRTIAEATEAQHEKRLMAHSTGWRSVSLSRQHATEQHTPFESSAKDASASQAMRKGVDLEAVRNALLQQTQGLGEQASPSISVAGITAPRNVSHGDCNDLSKQQETADHGIEESPQEPWKPVAEAAKHIRGQHTVLLATLWKREKEQRQERIRHRSSPSASESVSRQATTEQGSPRYQVGQAQRGQGRTRRSGETDLHQVRRISQAHLEARSEVPADRTAAAGASHAMAGEQSEAIPAGMEIPASSAYKLECAQTIQPERGMTSKQYDETHDNLPTAEEFGDAEGAKRSTAEHVSGEHTFRPPFAAQAFSRNAADEAVKEHSGHRNADEVPEATAEVHKPTHTPVWGSSAATSSSGKSSIASSSDSGNSDLISATDTGRGVSGGRTARGTKRGEETNEAWLSQQEALVRALHRHAAARVIQHAWRRRRLTALFDSVVKLIRRKAQSPVARRSASPCRPVAFSDRAVDILERTRELSPTWSKSAHANKNAMEGYTLTTAPQQFVPVVIEPPSAVVLFKGSRRGSNSRRPSDSSKPQEHHQQQLRQRTTGSIADVPLPLSDSGSQGSSTSEGLPAIVLKFASQSPSLSEEEEDSDSSSHVSSRRDSSDFSDDALSEPLGSEASSEGHEDEVDKQKRLRRIMREGLDSKMRSTLAGSHVLLPRNWRLGGRGSSTSPVPDTARSVAFNADPSNSAHSSLLTESQGRRDGPDARPRTHSGFDAGRGSGLLMQKAQGRYQRQRAAGHKSQKRCNSFLYPEWPKDRTDAVLEHDEPFADSMHQPTTRILGTSSESKIDSDQAAGFPAGAAAALEERASTPAKNVEGLDRVASGSETELPSQKFVEEGTWHSKANVIDSTQQSSLFGSSSPTGCTNCKHRRCFCCFMAQQTHCDDTTHVADPLPRSPRKDSPRLFSDPPFLVPKQSSVAVHGALGRRVPAGEPKRP